MESKAIPTIEKCFYIYAQAIGYGNWENLMKCLQFEPDTLNKHIKIVTHEYAVLFAQYHVQETKIKIAEYIKIMQKLTIVIKKLIQWLKTLTQ